MKTGIVKSVSKSETHTFSKSICKRVVLLIGFGVEGDAHSGKNVKHRSRVAKDILFYSFGLAGIVQLEMCMALALAIPLSH